jgi:hypothetical protein
MGGTKLASFKTFSPANEVPVRKQKATTVIALIDLDISVCIINPLVKFK